MFKVNDFFDLENVSFKELFDNVENVWEAIPKIDEYISNQFESGKLQQNYKENVYIGEGTTIEEGAFIKGPAIIGKNCVIRHGAYIRENCLLADNVLIGHATEIKHSIILNNSVVNHFNYVGDSVIGCNINLGAGSVAANLRLDKQNVSVWNGDQKIDTGLKKFGAIIGDGSEIGINAVLNPGTILGKKVIVYPLTSIKGVHKDGEILRS